MPSPTKELLPGPMSLFDKISLSWLVPLAIARALFGFGSRMADSSSLNWRQKLSISLLQALRRTLSPRHTFSHSRRRLTGAAVRNYCRSRRLDYATVTVALPEHSPVHETTTRVPCPTLHIVTPANAPSNGPALLYAHGGGYLNPLQAPGHMPFALHCAASCGASRVILVEYALSSEHGYPTQLIQMVATMKHLFRCGVESDDTRGLQPENLILAGDSAGGHLIVSLLAHAVRPSPYAPPLPELSGEKGKQLRAVALISPWVTMKTTDASFTANHESDFLSAQQAEIFIHFFEPSPTEVWASPIEADDAVDVWKAAFPPTSAMSVAKRTLVTSGAGETLFDSCVKFGAEFLHADMVVLDSDDKVALAAGKDLVLTIAPDEAHVQPVLDSAIGYPHGWSMKAIDAFLKSI
ncbi:hypothetical protein LLEC1_00903 [Akanthomyces lecanii]|uniref:Alpha/beta hydrolase fold-3 domain-containing protein n=1 Tax=Cordyceps confragosa TaxID=2714763 RepID=A0A179IPU3_CORDF|nr:hypothetical protein LLEC1_00903 [Akanthomyces lecanii]